MLSITPCFTMETGLLGTRKPFVVIVALTIEQHGVSKCAARARVCVHARVCVRARVWA
jgi:hypothetical protein